MNQQLQKIFARLTAIGAASGDSDDLRLQKSLLVMFTFPFLIAGVTLVGADDLRPHLGLFRLGRRPGPHRS